MSSEENTIKWIKKDLVPNILKSNHLEKDVLKKTEVIAIESMKNNWASSMFEINLFLGREEKTVSLLVKVVNEDPNVRREMNSDRQFFNEIHFYSKVVPLISSHVSSPYLKLDLENLFPKHCYSYYNIDKLPETFEDAVLVLENLKPQNYILGNRTFLDFKHCILALERLGSFHAFSYFLKERDADNFMEKLVRPIRDSYFDTSVSNGFVKMDGSLSVAEQRVIDSLASDFPGSDPILTRLRELVARKPIDVFLDAIDPQEPQSVLCHGDFLRNNVLYRYENGVPVDLKMIDFQAIRYASPAIDVSLFICMNTSHELRQAEFEHLLQAYHSSVAQTLASLLGKSKDELDERYSYESFLSDFRRRAVYGYLVALFFLPWMLVGEEELAEIVKLHWEERESLRYIETTRHLGGARVTREMVQLAKDLFEKQCL